MGFASSEPDPKKAKLVGPFKKAKAQYGLKMPEGSSPTGGALVAQIAAGMFLALRSGCLSLQRRRGNCFEGYIYRKV